MKYLFWVFLVLMAAAGVTQAAGRQHVKASILADVKTVKPGESFEVGVLLRIDPDWHIYWENPGESGSPTRAAIAAPAGVTVDAVRYPLPASFTQPGDIKGYGYEDEVMLIARVTVPKDWKAGKAIDLTADVSWLNCKDVCLQGKAKLQLSVAVEDARESDNAEEFSKWKAQLPMDAKEAEGIVTVSGSVSDLTLVWQKPAKEVEVLPVPPDGVEVASVDVKEAEKETHIKPVLRLLGGEKKPGAALGLLVTYDDQAGQRHGVRLSIPLKKTGE